MSESHSIQVGPYTFSPANPLMTSQEFLDAVDESLMAEMRLDRTGILLKLYNHFGENKPMNPREFFEFMGSLSLNDHYQLMNFGDLLP